MQDEATQSTELQSMIIIENTLDKLDPDERERVIRWTVDRFGVATNSSRGIRSAGQKPIGPDIDPTEYETIAEFHDATNPNTDAARALVVGYWQQFVLGETEIKASNVNRELKNLGHESSNITNAFNALRAKKPALAVQVSKSGKSRQAHKKYKITEAGKKEVARMITGYQDED